MACADRVEEAVVNASACKGRAAALKCAEQQRQSAAA
jgi:hypothetical protein